MLKKILIAGLVFSSSVSAAGVSLEYKSLYNRMKEIHKDEYSLIKIGFYIPQTPDCLIKSGFIKTERNRYPLSYTEHQELLLPYDEKLKSDRALIHLELAGDSSKCGIQMQVNSTTKQESYKKPILKTIYNEMNDLMSSMQGFPLKYFSTDIQGITFYFPTKTSIEIDGSTQPPQTVLKLSKSKLQELNKISFSQKPLKISPWVSVN